MTEDIVGKQNIPGQNNSDTTENVSPFSRIRWGESYVSLILGALVVIVAALLGVFYVKMHQPKQELLPPATIVRHIKLTVTPEVSTTPSVKKETTSLNPKNNKERVYLVQKNDNLWNIAQKTYGSGYNWVSIARANNLANPGMVFYGDRLIIPSVSPIIVQNKSEQILPSITQKDKITPSVSPKPTETVVPQQTTTQNDAITGTVYNVTSGDSLWIIAIRAYNNGDRWVDIAKANNLANPSIIHSGNILKVPRTQTL